MILPLTLRQTCGMRRRAGSSLRIAHHSSVSSVLLASGERKVIEM